MDTLFKLLNISLMLSVLALPLTGCDTPPWESGMTLVLKIDTPKDGTTVTASPVTVSGRVVGTQSASAKVTINNENVPVKDGKYSTSVKLTQGTNVINVVATISGVEAKEKVTVTYATAK